MFQPASDPYLPLATDSNPLIECVVDANTGALVEKPASSPFRVAAAPLPLDEIRAARQVWEQRRRAHLMRYVGAGIVIAVVVCVAFLVNRFVL